MPWISAPHDSCLDMACLYWPPIWPLQSGVPKGDRGPAVGLLTVYRKTSSGTKVVRHMSTAVRPHKAHRQIDGLLRDCRPLADDAAGKSRPNTRIGGR